MEELTAWQYRQFLEALQHAFNRPALTRMLRSGLGKRLDLISEASSFAQVVSDVIDAAEREGWLVNLVHAACQDNPANPRLRAFVQQAIALPTTLDRPDFERKLRTINPFFDLHWLLAKLARIELQVGRIEFPLGSRHVYGTCFLIGPDVILTNYHVMEEVIEGSVMPQHVRVLFDHKYLADRRTKHPGTAYALAQPKWLLAYSKPSVHDRFPERGVPRPDELDFALVALAGHPSAARPGDSRDIDRLQRGWIEVSSHRLDIVIGTPLLIIQHPDAEPLKLALEMDGIIGLNGNHTRITYRTSTEQVSSGAPCFDSNLELIALHHLGSPDNNPTYNQGIPIFAIINHLIQQGQGKLLGL